MAAFKALTIGVAAATAAIASVAFAYGALSDKPDPTAADIFGDPLQGDFILHTVDTNAFELAGEKLAANDAVRIPYAEELSRLWASPADALRDYVCQNSVRLEALRASTVPADTVIAAFCSRDLANLQLRDGDFALMKTYHEDQIAKIVARYGDARSPQAALAKEAALQASAADYAAARLGPEKIYENSLYTDFAMTFPSGVGETFTADKGRPLLSGASAYGEICGNPWALYSIDVGVGLLDRKLVDFCTAGREVAMNFSGDLAAAQVAYDDLFKKTFRDVASGIGVSFDIPPAPAPVPVDASGKIGRFYVTPSVPSQLVPLAGIKVSAQPR
ncbi:MAG: hypothetical protein P4M15_10610 [Alphaproteobacteria bacterium]|nr:hypothetical protein [Alphaproteobacteria bacterium]